MSMARFLRLNAVLVLSLLWVGESLAECEEAAVRLVDGPSCNCGRVEVCHDDVWGTICDDDWDYRDAIVVCKQLGYETYEQRFIEAYFGEGDGPIWLDNMRCAASYVHITQCSNRLQWGDHNCDHDEDAGVCCKRTEAPKPDSLPVRVTCPPGGSCQSCPDRGAGSSSEPQVTLSGIVEVQVDGEWCPLTADFWTPNAASVVCGQLGYPMSIPENEVLTDENITDCYSESLVDDGSGYGAFYCPNFTCIFDQEFDCSGKEIELKDCFFPDKGCFHYNHSERVAAIQCGYRPLSDTKTVRLRAGPVPWMGRLEVFVNDEWGTVCDTNFDIIDGNVVCRWLGYGGVETIYGRASMGKGVLSSRVHYTQCQCTGKEKNLTECNCDTGYYADRCGHDGDVGLVCKIPSEECSSIKKDVKLSMYEVSPYAYLPWIVNLYPEFHMRNPLIVNPNAIFDKGLLCYSVVTQAVGEVMCREAKMQFLFRIVSGSEPQGYNGASYEGAILCTGEESGVSECGINIYPILRCREYAIIECTSVAADLATDINVLKRSLVSRYYVNPIPMYLLTCAHEENCLSSSADAAQQNDLRRLLKFDSQAWNTGTADFRPVSSQEDWVWHICHNHYHSMEEFVHYDLFNLTTGVKVAEGHKASFCLEDSLCSGNNYPRYRCSSRQQGISRSCSDLYGSHLDCQWIDITGVPPGEYLLVTHLNPHRLIVESDYKNNKAFCVIELIEVTYYSFKSLTITVDRCWLSDH